MRCCYCLSAQPITENWHKKDINLCLLYEWELAHRFFIVGRCTVYESWGNVGIYSVKENCHLFPRPCLNCALVRMCIRHTKPFRMRNVTLTFPVAHAHTCLLETGGPLTFYPSNLQWHWLTPFFRIGLWIDTLVPKGLRLIKIVDFH
jgi:hypothetical protein